jgi:SAM-dependent methyltransferase
MKQRTAVRTETDRTVQFYDSIATQYDMQMEALPGSHWVRAAFLDFVARTVPSGSQLLDFGCGTGADAAWYADNGYRVVGCDQSTGMIEQFRLKHAARIATGEITAYDGKLAELRDIPGRARAFDAVVSDFAVLNLIREPGIVFEAFADLLRSDGHVVVSVLNPLFWKDLREPALVKSWLLSFGQSAIFTDGHHTELYRHHVRTLCRAAEPHFRMVGRASVGALIRRTRGPRDWRHPVTLAERIESRMWMRFPMTRLGQFFFLSFQRR